MVEFVIQALYTTTLTKDRHVYALGFSLFFQNQRPQVGIKLL